MKRITVAAVLALGITALSSTGGAARAPQEPIHTVAPVLASNAGLFEGASDEFPQKPEAKTDPMKCLIQCLNSPDPNYCLFLCDMGL